MLAPGSSNATTRPGIRIAQEEAQSTEQPRAARTCEPWCERPISAARGPRGRGGVRSRLVPAGPGGSAGGPRRRPLSCPFINMYKVHDTPTQVLEALPALDVTLEQRHFVLRLGDHQRHIEPA